jgi:AraC-like DNA-binding protein
MKQKPDMPARKREMDGILLWKRPTEIAGFSVFTSHAGVESCLDFMVKNFCRPIQLKDLVKISGMSLRGVNKAFHKNVGLKPGAMLRHLRIEYAKRLLVEQDLKLRQVAKRCGYRSENTFCVAFQRATRTSPKKFQTQYVLATCREHQQGRIQPMMAALPVMPALGRNVSMRFHEPKYLPAKRML